ncbi:MAG: LpxL/LpxP family acyltransferase, partial [Marinobacter sp.]
MKKKYRRQARNTDYSAYRHPRWWPTWAGIAVMWCAAQLPIRFQWWLGKQAGMLAWRFASRRRHIAEVNIRLCFPELTKTQQAALVRNSFTANGIGLMELGIAWFRNPAKLKGITEVHGKEHLDNALAEGKGVLLLGGHYSTLDLGGSLVTEYI